MSLIKWNSRNHVPTFSNLLENFFNDDLNHFIGSEFGGTIPSVNVKEDENNFILEVAAPGLSKEDFKINVDNDLLSISAEVKKESEDKNGIYTRKEFNYATFKRTFTLPKSIESDKIEASYQNGILVVKLPKKEEAKKKPLRQIEIS